MKISTMWNSLVKKLNEGTVTFVKNNCGEYRLNEGTSGFETGAEFKEILARIYNKDEDLFYDILDSEDNAIKRIIEGMYEAYKKTWCDEHLSPAIIEKAKKDYALMLEEEEMYADEYSFDEYIEEYGYGQSELYVCFDEWLDNDFMAEITDIAEAV